MTTATRAAATATRAAAGASAGLARYGALLRRGPVVRPFAAALLARLPISMAPVGTVLLVEHARGSYAVAGLVSGAFAIGIAIGSPGWGRAMDRLGQSRVIVPTVLVSASLLCLLALGAGSGVPVAVLVAASAGAGATFPPFSAAMRASWRSLIPETAARRAGYAMDAAAVETLFVLGPLLLSLLLVVTPPVVPLLVTAALLLTGGLLYAGTSPARRRVAPSARAPRRGPRLAPGGPRLALGPLPAVYAVALAMSVAFGVTDTTLAATARSVLDDQSTLGLLFAAIATGSTLGGLAYGTSGSGRREHARMPVVLGGFALGLGALALVLSAQRPSVPALVVLLFVTGLMISPALIVQQNIVDALAPDGRATEAQSWLSTAITAGLAGGTALAGAVVDAAGVAASLASGCAAVVVAVGVALACQGTWRRAAQPAALDTTAG